VSSHLQHLNGVGYLEKVGSAGPVSHAAGERIDSPTQAAARRPVRVLLIGAGSVGCWPFSEHLEESGYHCEYVPTCLEAARLIAQGSFDLTLCSVRVKGFELLLGAVRHSLSSLFRYVLVEDGCWWVPTVLRGESCPSVPAFRGTEFAGALDTMIREVQSGLPSALAVGAGTGNGSDGTGHGNSPPEP